MTKQSTAKSSSKTRASNAQAPSLKLKKGRPSLEEEKAISAAIVAAAAQQFLSRGYDATSIEGIAKQIGIYKNAVYKRFPSKHVLFREVMEAKLAEWTILASAQEDNPGTTLEEKLRSHIKRTIKWSTNPEVRAFRKLRMSACEETDNFAQEIRIRNSDTMVKRVAEDIRACTATDKKPAKNPEAIARALLSQIAGWLESQPDSAKPSKKAIDQFTKHTVELLIYGREVW